MWTESIRFGPCAASSQDVATAILMSLHFIITHKGKQINHFLCLAVVLVGKQTTTKKQRREVGCVG